MELKGSKTEQNLWAAFAGESQARNKYTYYASKAKKDGYVQIAKIFEETAANEKEHAKIWFKLVDKRRDIASMHLPEFFVSLNNIFVSVMEIIPVSISKLLFKIQI